MCYEKVVYTVGMLALDRLLPRAATYNPLPGSIGGLNFFVYLNGTRTRTRKLDILK